MTDGVAGHGDLHGGVHAERHPVDAGDFVHHRHLARQPVGDQTASSLDEDRWTSSTPASMASLIPPARRRSPSRPARPRSPSPPGHAGSSPNRADGAPNPEAAASRRGRVVADHRRFGDDGLGDRFHGYTADHRRRLVEQHQSSCRDRHAAAVQNALHRGLARRQCWPACPSHPWCASARYPSTGVPPVADVR